MATQTEYTGGGPGRVAQGAWSGQPISEALESADRFARDGEAPLAARRAELAEERQVSRGGDQGARLSPARSDAASNERAGGRNAAADGELASYGNPTPGSVSAQGFHYSGAERKQLDGRYYGTGAKGREADRVLAAQDKWLRERSYFYVDAGNVSL